MKAVWRTFVTQFLTLQSMVTMFHRVITPDVKDNMKSVLKDIQNGNFANSFVKDNENGFKEFYKLREQQHGHEIEAVGRELRKMMPFIKSKSIQNKC